MHASNIIIAEKITLSLLIIRIYEPIKRLTAVCEIRDFFYRIQTELLKVCTNTVICKNRTPHGVYTHLSNWKDSE